MQSLEAADETENTFNFHEEFSKISNTCVSGVTGHHDLESALFDIHPSGLDLHQSDLNIHSSGLDLHQSDLNIHATGLDLNLHQSDLDLHQSALDIQSGLGIGQSGLLGPESFNQNGHDQIGSEKEKIKLEFTEPVQVKQEENDTERDKILADLGLKQDGCTQLGKLVSSQNLNFLTLTIHSETEFSIQLPHRSAVMFPLTADTHASFLAYISTNRIPGVLYEYVMSCNMAEQLFYSGCLIVYVQNLTRGSKYFTLLGRDYSHHFKDLQYVRSSLPAQKDWSSSSLNQIESHLLLSTKLSLDVREDSYERTIQVHRSRHAYVRPSIRKCLRRHATALRHKARLSPYGEEVAGMNYLYDLCKRREQSEQSEVTKTRSNSATTKSEKREPDTDQEKVLAFNFGVSQINRLSKRYERPPDTNDWYPRLVEEYTLEAERGESRVYNKVSVSRRPTNGEFLGQMYVDHEYREDNANQTGASYNTFSNNNSSNSNNSKVQQQCPHTHTQLVNGDVGPLYSVGYQQCNSSSSSTIDDITREQTITAIANSLKTSSEQHQLQTEAAVKAQQAAAAQVLKPLPPSSTPTLNFLQSAGNTASPPQFRKVAISSRLPPSMPAGGSPLLINLATSGAQPGAMRVIPSQLKPQSTATGRIVNVNIQSGSNQSLQFLGKIQNKGATNVLGGASATTNNNNMIDTRTVQRFKVTPGSSGCSQLFIELMKVLGEVNPQVYRFLEKCLSVLGDNG
ncbi:uncharacterized protein LOC103524940 [Diaphorina citri]|uniref:Uncharacterized protein LOC103524940 n=1 Tax=Diaphorina citri TaxID=121845 RepID=A0A3Q0IIE3_DIACI|nr:uncharacterized protein LOC103524940 [Diaphorina citri]